MAMCRHDFGESSAVKQLLLVVSAEKAKDDTKLRRA